MSCKFVVTGLGRHGKDTVCEILRDERGLSFTSSSWFCARVLFPQMREKYGYASSQECFDDRHQHREEWYQAISNYNKDDTVRLSREIFAEVDVYCGIRSRAELLAAKAAGLVDAVVWVAGSETSASITITREDCDFVLNNDGTLEDLRAAALDLHDRILAKKMLAMMNSEEGLTFFARQDEPGEPPEDEAGANVPRHGVANIFSEPP